MSRFGIDKSIWASVVDRAPKRYLDRVGPDRVGPDRVVLAAAQCAEVASEARTRPFASLAAAERSDLAIECHGDNARAVIRNVLVEWVMAQKDAELAIGPLTKWDRKLGVWCACACAETVLKYVHPQPFDGVILSRLALEAARRWSFGRATIKQVRRAAQGAEGAADPFAVGLTYDTIHAIDFAALASVYASMTAAQGEGHAIFAVTTTALVRTDRSGLFLNADEEFQVRQMSGFELGRLREVVADAIVNYPTGEMVNASRGVAGRNVLVAGALGAVLGAGAMHIARKL